MFAFDETKEYVFIKCTYMYYEVHVCCVITAVSIKNRENETNEESDSE